MKGRKPNDVSMKLVTGNPGHRPVPAVSDQAFTADAPEKPDWLTGDASEEWDRLVVRLESVLSAAAAGAVLVASSAFAQMRAAERIIVEQGMFYTTTNKDGLVMQREHPAVGVYERARNSYFRALSELGATPVGHSRVKRLPEDTQTTLPGINRFFTSGA